MHEIEQAICKWVPMVNAEYGLSDKNDFSIEWFKKLIGVAEFVIEDDYYLVYLVAPDMWGEKILNVVSFYIVPQKRRALSLKVFKHMMRFAKQKGCARIAMGCHLGDTQTFNQFLSACGFKPQTFTKEV